jgi:hypothetical protein
MSTFPCWEDNQSTEYNKALSPVESLRWQIFSTLYLYLGTLLIGAAGTQLNLGTIHNDLSLKLVVTKSVWIGTCEPTLIQVTHGQARHPT